MALVEFRLATADEDLRRTADAALAAIRNPQATAVLQNVLALTDDPQLLSTVQRALAGMLDGEAFLREVAHYWRLDDDEMRRRLADVFSLQASPDLVPLHATLLQTVKADTPEPLCVAAVHALVQAGTPEAYQALLAAAGVTSEPVAAFVLDGIGRLSNPDLLPYLAYQATQPRTANPALRLAAVTALGNFEGPEAQKVLAALPSPDFGPEVAAAAGQSLLRLSGYREFTYEP
jgi:hypothetical protein